MRHITRFERQIDIPEIGLHGQDKLAKSSVLIVGTGGLGCPAALYLAAAGVGSLTLIDSDTVSLSNLQRQILFTENDIGRKKTETAKEHLQKVSSLCTVSIHSVNIDKHNATDLIEKHDIVLDCSDNFETRFLLNQVCYIEKKKLVSASLYHLDGQISVFKPFEGPAHPCYECLYPNNLDNASIPNCKQSGVVGPVAGVLGTMQASAAITELLDIGASLSGYLLMFNALNFEAEKVRIYKKKNCPCCSQEASSLHNKRALTLTSCAATSL